MIHDLPNHRGCHLTSEQKATKRRFWKPGLRVSLSSYYKGLRMAFQRDQQEEIDKEVSFMADPLDIRWLRLNHQLLFPRG